ncbi:MAG TPA: hypothetical protein VMU06_10700 [Stellaceae bacterium]|nr:hypothetical protein [Stellaceae bacterium]
MAAAGREALECMRALAETGGSVVAEALKCAEGFYEWEHYPAGDVYDPASHAQFYYHAHPPAERGGEHGHFHTFLRPRGMPAGTRPMMLPELAIPDAPAQPQGPVRPPAPQPCQGEDNEKLSHLIAISMSPRGMPIRLFTTNRWVTGETWYRAEDVVRMLERFVVNVPRPSPALNRWVGAMFVLFRPQMAALLAARDAAIMQWRRRHRGKIHVLEDRRLEVTSALAIDIEDQLRRVESALKRVA